MNTTITWIPTAASLPDDDATVLIAVDGEPWTGFLSYGQWRYENFNPIEGVVSHWAEFPEVPQMERAA